MRGSTISHSSSVSGASSGAIAVVLGSPASLPDGLSGLRARLVARLAFLQRAGTAWCARLHTDPSELEDSLLLVRLGHGKQHASNLRDRLNGIRSASRSPFYRPCPRSSWQP